MYTNGQSMVAAPGTPPGNNSMHNGDIQWGMAAANGQGLNPTARPFQVPSPVDGPKSPGTPGSKRTHNPYAAVCTTPDETPLPQQNSFESNNFNASGSFGGSISPVSPGLMGSGNWMHQGAPMPAAPLPTSLPQRGNAMMNNQHMGNQMMGGHQHHQGNSRGRYHNQAGPHQQQQQQQVPTYSQPVSMDEVLSHAGGYVEMARTATGSSFIQAAVREGSDPNNLSYIWSELQPCLGDLLLDSHGCYVIKSVLEKLLPQDLEHAVASIANDPQLVFSMCTHSLHTRRVVQYLLETVECTFIIQMLINHVVEIATTQQGCIVMQKAMDVAQEPLKGYLYNSIYSNLVRFSMDPFANYVVQHLLEVGDRAHNTEMFRPQFLPNCVDLACNKFASNVMEKALFHLDEHLQHDLLVAIYSSGEDVLYRMLQDSFGNYLIQSSIALASYKDIFFMSEKLRPVLQRTPYGHKIEARLERRLKGKAVGTRSPMIGAQYKATMNGPSRGPRGGSGGRRPGSGSQDRASSTSSGYSDDGNMVEEPW